MERDDRGIHMSGIPTIYAGLSQAELLKHLAAAGYDRMKVKDPAGYQAAWTAAQAREGKPTSPPPTSPTAPSVPAAGPQPIKNKVTRKPSPPETAQPAPAGSPGAPLPATEPKTELPNPAPTEGDNIAEQLRQLQIARQAGGLSPEAEREYQVLTEYQEWVQAQPSDFFPAGTTEAAKKKLFAKVNVVKKNQKMDKIKADKNLDRQVEEKSVDIAAAKKQNELDREAVRILTKGEPLDLFKKAYELNHEGDNEILRATIYGTCLQSSSSARGLQVFISGGKGTGKSNAIKASINLIPPEQVTQGSFSDKAFFYQLAGKKKPVVFLDDITISDSQVAIMKRCMTNFQSETEHHTISGTERKPEVMTIPARTMWLGTAVSETGDDQLKNRYLSLDIIPGETDNAAYIKWEVKRRQEGRPEIEVNADVLTARAIIAHIKSRDFVVKGFTNIKFKYDHDRRLANIALDLIEGSAILHYLQRDHKEIDGTIHVTPTVDDLTAALDFSMFRITDIRSEGRLTRTERALDELIQKHMKGRDTIELTEREIVDLSGKTTNPVRTLLFGRDGTQNKITGGLCEKANWYRIDRENVVSGKGEYETTRRMGQAVIVISKHDYGPEHSGSFAWLENADGTVK